MSETPNSPEIPNQGDFEFIVIRGLDDVKPPFDRLMSMPLKASRFDSNWNDSETLHEKSARLHQFVTPFKNQGKKLIFLGLSAGAGLSEVYELEHPGEISHIFSFDGVLDPKSDNPQIQALFKKFNKANSFREMVGYLQSHLTFQNKQLLGEKITAYYSLSDKTVPIETEKPSWIKGGRRSAPNLRHAPAIIATILFDTMNKINQIRNQGTLFSEAPSTRIN